MCLEHKEAVGRLGVLNFMTVVLVFPDDLGLQWMLQEGRPLSAQQPSACFRSVLHFSLIVLHSGNGTQIVCTPAIFLKRSIC